MTTAPHLDDDALSAFVDGEATADEAVHAESCGTCAPRLAALRAAATAIGAPVAAPDDAARSSAIAAALGAASLTNVVPMRRRVPPAWLGAAAAALVVVAGVAVALGRGDDDAADAPTAAGLTTTTFSADEDQALQEMAADAGAGATMAAAAPVDGGDLGDLSQVDLEATVRAALDGSASATGSSPADEPSTTRRSAATTCDEQVRAAHPELGGLVYHAAGTLDGVDVTVLAYDLVAPDGAVQRAVYVVEAQGCVTRQERQFAA